MLTALKSISIENRNTNIELLRIVSMFLVLCVHADFLSLGIPNLKDFTINPIEVCLKSFIESLSIVCVNVFVMISGWFGIRASIKGLCNFLFQCLYFSVGLYVISVCVNQTYRTSELIASFLMSSYWFIPAYIALFILSPAINALFDRYKNKQILYILVVFYTFQTIFGCTGIAKFIDYGYSCFSFIGLYILAKLIRRITDENPNILNRKKVFLGVYFLSSILITILFFFITFCKITWNAYMYINPFVVISSASLLLLFNSIQIKQNRFINYFASSIFAVYLLHLNKYFGLDLFKETIQMIYTKFHGVISILDILLFLLIIMILAFILDQPRKICWYYISNLLYKRNWFSIKIVN